MQRSQIDKRGRTTLPLAVREALDLRPGDALSYEVKARSVALRRADDVQLTDEPFATFDEWSGEADKAAYRDL